MFLLLVAQAEHVIIFASSRNSGVVLDFLNVVHLQYKKKKEVDCLSQILVNLLDLPSYSIRDYRTILSR